MIQTTRWLPSLTLGLLLTELGCSAPPPSSTPSQGGSVGTSGGSGGSLSTGGAGLGGSTVSSGGTVTSGGSVGSGGGPTSSGGASLGGTTSGGAVSGGTAGTSNSGGAPNGGATVGGAAGGSGKAGGGAAGGGMTGAGGSSGSSSGGASLGGAGSDVCPRLDPANPPKVLSVSGNLGTHDPSLIAVDGTYYLFQTGRGLPTKTSKDLMSWQSGAAVFSGNPSWVAQQVPAASDLWAPDISFFGGTYHLYYSASSFGSNKSCIGHATRASLSSGSWTDQGPAICSNAGSAKDNWNAIDPNVIIDEKGTPWLAFGSFWSGIKMFQLDAAGVRIGTELLSIANRPQNGGSLEGAFIVRACGYYYLFVSWDHCCDSPWNYNMRVGRSTSVTGPYVDKAGTMMTQGGGTLLVEGNGTLQGPGHNAVIITPAGAYNVYHALNPSNHAGSLRVAQIAWDDQGWPVTAGP